LGDQEVKLRFRNEIYDFYLTGVLLLPTNFNANHLSMAAHFVIMQVATTAWIIE
jgi:hypothetical protein